MLKVVWTSSIHYQVFTRRNEFIVIIYIGFSSLLVTCTAGIRTCCGLENQDFTITIITYDTLYDKFEFSQK